MSARIAPDPISATISTTLGFRARGSSGDTPQSAAGHHPSNFSSAPLQGASAALETRAADILPPLPPPPDPPGTAYVAAVLSGALSPKPTSAREVFLRVGEWTPPDSPLRLADKTV